MNGSEEAKIVIGDNFKESFPEILGVLPSAAKKVARDPDKQDVIECGEENALKVRISVGSPDEENHYYLLVLDRVDENGVRVIHDAFKFYDDLCPDVSGKSPTSLLEAIADRFAFTVKPSGNETKLVIKESVPCEPEKVNTDTIIRMMMPTDMKKGEQVLGTQYIMYDVAKRAVEFAVAFVWNVTRYREYLAERN